MHQRAFFLRAPLSFCLLPLVLSLWPFALKRRVHKAGVPKMSRGFSSWIRKFRFSFWQKCWYTMIAFSRGYKSHSPFCFQFKGLLERHISALPNHFERKSYSARSVFCDSFGQCDGFVKCLARRTNAIDKPEIKYSVFICLWFADLCFISLYIHMKHM